MSTGDIEILDLIELENGAQPPKSQHIYSYQRGYIRFVQNRDYHTNQHMTYIPISKKNHLCLEDDILIDKYGKAGSVRYGIVGAFNVALLKIIPKDVAYKEYIRDFLLQPKIQKILSISSQASTRSSLNESTFVGLKIPTISKQNLIDYHNIGINLLNTELKLKQQILKLLRIKDILLKKYF